MGDMFVERPDGSLDFVDRAKYLIKSGGENIYPVEIERVLMADPGVLEAVVVRRPDRIWGEVPVAFVVPQSDHVTPEYLMKICRDGLSSYKCPREIRLLSSQDEFPRSTSGKVQRQIVEQWLN
jgi:fatty-acyl-CoA synthase